MEGYVHGIHNGIPYLLVYNTPEKSMKHTGDDATDWKFETARVGQDQWGSPAVNFGFDERGGIAFGKLTGANIEKPLCTVLDNKVITLASIRSRITTNGEITGSFSMEEVRDIVQKMKSGALRGKLSDSPVSETSVDAQLGATQRSAGLKAALIAVIAVVVFMLIYYFVPLGLVADIAVLFNLLYLLGSMAMIHASFTLPGIAGLILTIGIAVDANVLIDERIREEQAKGYNLRTALKNGYNRAFSVIIDSHITAILTTVILYFVGTTEIKGFAMTLGIGLVFSLFTSVFLTRWLLTLAVEYGWIKNHVKMLKVIGVPKIRWMDKRYIFWGTSLVTLTLGVGAFFYQSIYHPQELYDVQFIGGTTAQVALKADAPADEDKLAKMLEDRSDLFKAVSIRKVEMESQPAAGAGATYDIIAPAAKERADDFAKDLIDALSHPNKDRSGKDKDYGLGVASLLPAGRDALEFDKETKAAWDKVALAVKTHADLPTELPPGVFRIDSAWMSQAGDINMEAFKDGVGVVVSGLKPAKLEDLGSRINAQLNTKYRKLPTNRLPEVASDEAVSGWELFGLAEAGTDAAGAKLYSKVLYVARDNQYISGVKGEVNPRWLPDFALQEVAAVHDAFSLPQQLSSLNSVGSSVAGDLVVKAWLAIILSMVVIMIYIGVRFGNWLFGLGAIIPIFHDAGVVIGLVAISKFIASTWLGQALLISDFRFDLTVVAAVLTVIGYSTNDTIVVFDRIRENRGRLSYITGPLIDNSVNQTLSRTILTSLTVFLVIIIMYVLGGQGIRAFNYAMLVGVVTGTYSSIAIAAPVLLGWRRMVHKKLTAALERTTAPADAAQGDKQS
jgi:SecD/SecF fusion protein